MSKIKTVSIVGAGPGDYELLTLKALRLIKEAEAVVYDRLISEEILAMIPDNAEKYFAGKFCKNHVMTQDEINELIVKLAQDGLKVVRLKGGDPFIFGRGGEEAEFLASHNIPFEIIPGISAASGCSSHYNIPLTYRGIATSVRYITGHCKEPELAFDWKSLADEQTTLVIYMGLANLVIITKKLIENGLPEDFPLAIIENGTNQDGRIIISNLVNAVS
ncbi:MAG: uroporphyrinogen-III C-methyltransferase, partial [Pseudomonadota bacterium]